jgi:hypothetical protein
VRSVTVRLPNAHIAIIDLRKLREYSLNPDHPRGGHKSRVFASAVGLTAEHAELLREKVLQAAIDHEAVETGRDEYGTHYVVDFELKGPSRSAMVRSCWLVEHAVEAPRLTSCFVL